MNQRKPANVPGVRRTVLVTALLVAAGVVGGGAVAVLAHADDVARTAEHDAGAIAVGVWPGGS